MRSPPRTIVTGTAVLAEAQALILAGEAERPAAALEASLTSACADLGGRGQRLRKRPFAVIPGSHKVQQKSGHEDCGGKHDLTQKILSHDQDVKEASHGENGRKRIEP